MTKQQFIERETALVLDQLTRLGYWLEASDAESLWEHKKTWEPGPYTQVPLSVTQSIRRINASL